MGVPHNVLNAKNHAREAEIIAQAGRIGAITIATNMAGRGTDILLGGSPAAIMERELRADGYQEEFLRARDVIEIMGKCLDLERDKPRYIERGFSMPMILGTKSLPVSESDTGVGMLLRVLAECGVVTYDEPTAARWFQQYRDWIAKCRAEGDEVKKMGGLRVIGTERHEARRIDNQLRGRCGRQGDPGENGFIISLEDQLMILFASDWVKRMMTRMGWERGQAIQSGMVTRAIGKAQKKVEEHNFQIRKNLLEYDEVMDKQRKVIYAQRQRILEGQDLRDDLVGMVQERVKASIDRNLNREMLQRAWDWDGLASWFKNKFGLAWAEKELQAMPFPELKAFMNDEAEFAIDQWLHHKEEEEHDLEHNLQTLVDEHTAEESGNATLANLLREARDRYGFEGEASILKGLDPYQVFRTLVRECKSSYRKQTEQTLLDYRRQRERISEAAEQFIKSFSQPDYPGLQQWFRSKFGKDLTAGILRRYDKKELAERMIEEAKKAFDALEALIGPDAMRKHERFIMHTTIDTKWKDHLRAMDQLRAGIHTVAHAQIDPKVEFKRRGYDYFMQMLALIKEEVLDKVLKIQAVEVKDEDLIRRLWKEYEASHPEEFQAIKAQEAVANQESPGAPAKAAAPRPEPFKNQAPRVGRNDPCPCGSGKKYKNCCMKLDGRK